MNKKEIRYGVRMVLDAASKLECEDLHHKSRHQHDLEYACPAKYELDKYIAMVSEMLSEYSDW